MKKQTKTNPTPKRVSYLETPTLRFSPNAWAKLLYFRDHRETEIGGFGVADIDDLLYVREFVTVKQEVSVVSVEFDDEAVANHFEDQVDLGRKPEQFARIWIHTHPGDSPSPSRTDEKTFQRVFGRCDWAVMFILARGGKVYCRLRFNVGPGGQMEIPVEIDYTRPFAPSDAQAWKVLYQEHIKMTNWPDPLDAVSEIDGMMISNGDIPDELAEQLAEMEPEQRREVLEELAYCTDEWDQVSNNNQEQEFGYDYE